MGSRVWREVVAYESNPKLTWRERRTAEYFAFRVFDADDKRRKIPARTVTVPSETYEPVKFKEQLTELHLDSHELRAVLRALVKKRVLRQVQRGQKHVRSGQRYVFPSPLGSDSQGEQNAPPEGALRESETLPSGRAKRSAQGERSAPGNHAQSLTPPGTAAPRNHLGTNKEPPTKAGGGGDPRPLRDQLQEAGAAYLASIGRALTEDDVGELLDNMAKATKGNGQRMFDSPSGLARHRCGLWRNDNSYTGVEELLREHLYEVRKAPWDV